MSKVNVTQNEIDGLVQEAEQRIQIIIDMLEFHNINFNTYYWNDNRPTNPEHLRNRLNTWIKKFREYSVDPTKVSMVGFEHLDTLYVQKLKLVPLIDFLKFSQDILGDQIVQRCNDQLLNSIGGIINRYVMSNGFIPQEG